MSMNHTERGQLMRVRGLLASVILVAMVGAPAVSRAGGNPDAALGFHITPASGSNPCGATPAFSTGIASSVNPQPGEEFYVWIYACNASSETGVAGMEFGIDYGKGIDILDYSDCSDFHVPTSDWPRAGSGSLLAWSYQLNCQKTTNAGVNSVLAIAGVLHVVYRSPDRLSFIKHPTEEGGIRVADCAFGEDDVSGPQGTAGFGTPGYSPCAAPIETEGEITPAVGRGFPNPFRKAVEIQFMMESEGPVLVAVFDLAGRRVTTLLEGSRPSGVHRVTWDGTDRDGRAVSPGIYFYRIETRARTTTQKIVRLP